MGIRNVYSWRAPTSGANEELLSTIPQRRTDTLLLGKQSDSSDINIDHPEYTTAAQHLPRIGRRGGKTTPY